MLLTHTAFYETFQQIDMNREKHFNCIVDNIKLETVMHITSELLKFC